MTTLVTGATGFVGSWLVKRLAEEGRQVRVLLRKSSDMAELSSLSCEFTIGDITNIESLRQTLTGVDVVYHLAGLVGYSRQMRPDMELVNVQGTANVVQAISEMKTPAKLIYMSSVTAVGASFDGRPLNEESPYNLESLDLGYFETKRKAEVIVKKACANQRLEAVILNPSTIYGPGDAKKGSRKTQLKVAQGKLPFYTKGGVSVVSIHDVIDALLKAEAKGRSGERYILSGENLLIRDLFALIAEEAKQHPPTLALPNWFVKSLGFLGDQLEKVGLKGPLSSENAWTAILYHWFEHDKAKRELGFNPRPAREAIAESVKWILDNQWHSERKL